ncbi:alpha-1,4-glucan--maltose-1-phosphate maltosyltransferase [Aromatoleum anaerobium]|uniref:Alpha-1,4-glucan:maltose-1-phosphate maltosyltransferase n=1 Tax=Aromatoleum anaerobium TaxID=182180 RepID=A0ABX1PKW4_9RHOO|nr:alpha-1,4-glucan--maltose-1-phosphate maltosyltransferase [Aromatoleum anaerobium]MCK0508382.1 alpha-1,4-glucan--maltose-1-phosphate maltosyltransferase [Aromatoleum anaerobium]
MRARTADIVEDVRRVPDEGRIRAVIESVTPQVDGGRFAVKRVVGDEFDVEADCFADGHDAVLAMLCWRRDQDEQWHAVPMAAIGNERWRGRIRLGEIGRCWYTVTAWVDAFESWRRDLARRVEPDDIRMAGLIGADLIEETAERATIGDDRERLAAWARRLRDASQAEGADPQVLKALGLDARLGEIAARHPDRRFAAVHPMLPLDIDRPLARFGAWYELFPRSTAPAAGAHGTLRNCADRLADIAAMGFDVLYLPPIHPVGRERRKGPNNALVAAPDDVGSPWAIGAAEGGHLAVHPLLGTVEDLRYLIARAHEHGVELALDIALQCAPDHPWVTEHPEWFRRRPDGSVQYAENPPKKYQDIYPFDFETGDWQAMWHALAGIFRHWIAEGVRIFRVDNPHTKAFPFWEWAIASIRHDHPDVIFLAEAFTRPRVMHRLAKLGFTQSYTYFTWRNTRAELTEYFSELAHGPGADYFRPNVWPNTPDILPEYLQLGGRPAFVVRLVLAATLAASYGIYGPAFELMEHVPREPGSEEYLNSEKYQLREWDLDRPDSLAALIGRVNRVRRDNPALHANTSLRFLAIDNDQLIAYSKTADAGDNIIVVVANLDPHNVHSGWLELDLDAFGIAPGTSFQMHDLLSGARYLWSSARNFVRLDPQRVPAHLFVLRRRVRSERDFDYFL